MDFHKSKYILPNLFTLTSVGAGMYSIHLSTTAQSVSEMTLAAWLLVAAMICDAFDGRVARMTRTESEFGVQLDSLADAVSFGVAPAFLLFHWGMSELGLFGLFVAACYAACAVMRLARFNVRANLETGTERYFMGLPTPLAAGTVVAIVLAHVSFTETMTTGAAGSVAAIVVLLGGLMVSNVRYRTFKDLNFGGPALKGVAVIVVAAVTAAVTIKPSVTFVLIMVAYIFLGLGGGLVSLGRHFLVRTGDDEESDSADEPVTDRG